MMQKYDQVLLLIKQTKSKVDSFMSKEHIVDVKRNFFFYDE